MNNPTPKRMYTVTVFDGSQYTYASITTDAILAGEEFEKLKELNTEDRIGLFSQVVEATTFDYVHRLI